MHAARAEWPFARQEPSMVVLRWLTRMVLVPFAIFGGITRRASIRAFGRRI